MRTVNANIYHRIQPALPTIKFTEDRYNNQLRDNAGCFEYNGVHRLIPVADGFGEKSRFVQFVSHFPYY